MINEFIQWHEFHVTVAVVIVTGTSTCTDRQRSVLLLVCQLRDTRRTWDYHRRNNRSRSIDPHHHHCRRLPPSQTAEEEDLGAGSVQIHGQNIDKPGERVQQTTTGRVQGHRWAQRERWTIQQNSPGLLTVRRTIGLHTVQSSTAWWLRWKLFHVVVCHCQDFKTLRIQDTSVPKTMQETPRTQCEMSEDIW